MSTPQPTHWPVKVGDEETTAAFEPAEAPFEDSVYVLAPGASASMEHRTMLNLAGVFRARGLHTVRFNFLYQALKKGPPDRMPRLMECYAAVVEKVRSEIGPGHIFLGGHSMGGRTASMLAADGFACDGIVLLAYPLHPSGQPEKLRDAHLAQIPVPALCMNGTRDELCQQDLMQQVVAKLPATWTMHWLEGADHGFRVLKRSGRTDEDVLNEIGDVGRAWMGKVIAGEKEE
jgi:predicted alpha/beta-hydrolase family hydrolase